MTTFADHPDNRRRVAIFTDPETGRTQTLRGHAVVSDYNDATHTVFHPDGTPALVSGYGKLILRTNYETNPYAWRIYFEDEYDTPPTPLSSHIESKPTP